jgi:hypothetical protein
MSLRGLLWTLSAAARVCRRLHGHRRPGTGPAGPAAPRPPLPYPQRDRGYAHPTATVRRAGAAFQPQHGGRGRGRPAWGRPRQLRAGRPARPGCTPRLRPPKARLPQRRTPCRRRHLGRGQRCTSRVIGQGLPQNVLETQSYGRGGRITWNPAVGMAADHDRMIENSTARDSKSVARKGVLVRVRPGAPMRSSSYWANAHSSQAAAGHG